MPPKKMTASHKQALAEGRAEGRAVKAYLDALEQQKPRRGRKRTADSIGKRLRAIDEQLAEASSLQRLQLVQERRDLESELAGMGTTVDLSALEAGFVAVARSYSTRKGIEYGSWRELGVAADVLKRAGITRGAA
jgi:serine/threonine protein phosphatase PrpC